MPRAGIDLITISRQFGAGGGELARALGARLGWATLERDVVYRVAERLAVSQAAVERMDEHAPRFLTRLAAALLVLPPEAPTRLETERILDLDAVAAAARAVILEAARTPPLIVVGHGGQCMFHTRPGTLHIRVVAPVEERLQRIAGRLSDHERIGVADLHRMDTDRRDYLHRHFQCDWGDELLYDLVVNTGRVPVDAASEAIASLVVQSQPAPASS